MKGKPVDILLVEDNEDHIELTLRALKNNNLINDIHVVKMGRRRSILHTTGANTRTRKDIPGRV